MYGNWKNIIRCSIFSYSHGLKASTDKIYFAQTKYISYLSFATFNNSSISHEFQYNFIRKYNFVFVVSVCFDFHLHGGLFLQNE